MLTMEQVNALTPEEAVARLGHLFEHSPWIVAATWDRRPFASRAALHRALVGTMLGAPRERQEALLRAHPDLVGRAARAGMLTRSSAREQVSAGLDPQTLSPEELAAFARNNAAYRERFGFPFIICAREHDRASILAGFTARLGQGREEEIRTALGEVARIAWYRLTELVEGDDEMAREALP